MLPIPVQLLLTLTSQIQVRFLLMNLVKTLLTLEILPIPVQLLLTLTSRIQVQFLLMNLVITLPQNLVKFLLMNLLKTLPQNQVKFLTVIVIFVKIALVYLGRLTTFNLFRLCCMKSQRTKNQYFQI